MNDLFLQLVRLGIGHNASPQTISADWHEIKALAEKHGLSAVVLDGIEKLSVTSRPPQEFLLEWIGEVLQDYEYPYEQYRKTISELAGFYNQHGYQMMVLKGFACSLDWPKPEHRPCGDIDVWLFGNQKEADAVLARVKGIEVDTSEHHHTTFYWSDFMVENHYDFINTHHHYSHRGLEQVFKELGQDESHYVVLNGETVYLPSPNLHALFLIRHALNHFTSIGINLRQVLDWAFFAEKHINEINWQWLSEVLEKYHMTDFYNNINAICVKELGFQSNIFPSVQYVPEMKDRVLKEILQPEFDWKKAHDENVFKRIWFKYRRWKGGAWKRELCFRESPLESFIWGVKSHLLKPASI